MSVPGFSRTGNHASDMSFEELLDSIHSMSLDLHLDCLELQSSLGGNRSFPISSEWNATACYILDTLEARMRKILDLFETVMQITEDLEWVNLDIIHVVELAHLAGGTEGGADEVVEVDIQEGSGEV